MHRQRQGAQALRVRGQGQPGRDAQARADGGRQKLAPATRTTGTSWPRSWSRPPTCCRTWDAAPNQAIVDLGFRGVDADNPGVEIIHRGKYKSLTSQQRRWLKRRQATEPMIGQTKSDNRMDRCWLHGALGDALHALNCAAGYNI